MPHSLTVHHDRRHVDAVATGPITYADLEKHLLTERHYEGLVYGEFIDARGAQLMFTSAEIREMVSLVRKLSRESEFGPTAVLVSTDVAFGIMRMAEIFLEDVAEVRAFRDEREARAWLAAKSSGSSKVAGSD